MTYIFRLDGSIRVESSSSGYIQTHFWPASRAPRDSMAYRVANYTGGSLHDHTYGFKIDLDVVSRTNSFQTIEYKMASTLDAVNEQREELGEPLLMAKPSYLLFDQMRYFTFETVETEVGVNIDTASPKFWIFGDQNVTNAWGNMRAYKLSLDATTSNVVNPEHQSMPAFSFSKNMLTVTQYKYDEETATGAYDLNRMDDPQGALDDAVDGESIVQEDLVLWVTLTAMHLPTAEDIPMVPMIEHGFNLKPWNMFDENPTMDMPHYLRMNYAETDRVAEENYPEVDACVPVEYDNAQFFSGA